MTKCDFEIAYYMTRCEGFSMLTMFRRLKSPKHYIGDITCFIMAWYSTECDLCFFTFRRLSCTVGAYGYWNNCGIRFMLSIKKESWIILLFVCPEIKPGNNSRFVSMYFICSFDLWYFIKHSLESIFDLIGLCPLCHSWVSRDLTRIGGFNSLLSWEFPPN